MPNENEISLTPEERKQPVTFGDLHDTVALFLKEYTKQQNSLWETNTESIYLILTKLIDRINDERYERIRFEHFVLGLICKIMLIDKEKVEMSYKKYCKGFDELNKKQKGSGDNA